MADFKKIRFQLHEIIFEADTPAGKAFDLALILVILASVVAVMLDSMKDFRAAHEDLLFYLEWSFTILFTIEYLLRLWVVNKPGKYATSFFGMVDLLSILPTYLSLLFPGGQYLMVIRALRMLRIWRILKLGQHVAELNQLMQALRASMRKLVVFLLAVLILVMILGSLMYLIEAEENGFTSIPRGIYWAIVTVTTVGYGDISPQTDLGQVLASVAMILGYAIIAIPTGIVTVELATKKNITTQSCPDCSREGHDFDAIFCKFCSSELNPEME